MISTSSPAIQPVGRDPRFVWGDVGYPHGLNAEPLIIFDYMLRGASRQLEWCMTIWTSCPGPRSLDGDLSSPLPGPVEKGRHLIADYCAMNGPWRELARCGFIAA